MGQIPPQFNPGGIIEKGKPVRAATLTGMINDTRRNALMVKPPSSRAVKPLRSQEAGGIISALNTTGTAFAPYEVAIMADSTLQTEPGERSLVVNIEEKSSTNSASKLCFVRDRINPGEIGKVVAVGVTWAKADGATTGNFASVEDGSRELTLGDTGEAVVVSGGGNAFVMVSVGGGGGSGAGRATVNWQVIWNLQNEGNS